MPSQTHIEPLFQRILRHMMVLTTIVYVMSLTCSMAGMEIFGWGTCFFFFVYLAASIVTKFNAFHYNSCELEWVFAAFIVVGVLGLAINAPFSQFVFGMGHFRNIILIFVFIHVLQLFKDPRRLITLLLIMASAIAVYGIWQHYTGIDLWRHDHRALQQVPDSDGYGTVGLFNHHLTYGHSYMMIICFPWALLLLDTHAPKWRRALYFLSFVVIAVSLIFTYGRGVWIAVLFALPVMALLVRRRLFVITSGLLIAITGLTLILNPVIRGRADTIFAKHYSSNDVRKELWASNIEMFKDHPWIGVGYKQNERLEEQYYERMHIRDGMIGHAHNNYLQILATMGLLGFTPYFLFILMYLVIGFRVFKATPENDPYSRACLLAILGAQIAIHVGGLTQWNFGDMKVQHQFLFWFIMIVVLRDRNSIELRPSSSWLWLKEKIFSPKKLETSNLNAKQPLTADQTSLHASSLHSGLFATHGINMSPGTDAKKAKLKNNV